MTLPPEITYTSSSLTSFRACPRQYQLSYRHLLTPAFEDAEALTIGTLWHRAHEARALGHDPYHVIYEHAPSTLWAVKLANCFAGQEWYWSEQPLDIIEPEEKFHVEHLGREFRGQRDGVVRDANGDTWVLERKTTSASIAPGSIYWAKLRLDVQIGIYSRTMPEPPAGVIYDVMRKPTIKPKMISAANCKKLASTGEYCGRKFDEAEVETAVSNKYETEELFGARLFLDIQEQPGRYFARQIVRRSLDDYASLDRDLSDQIEMIEACEARGSYPRNPNSCDNFSGCVFTRLCENNVCPSAGETPDGYYRREHAHRELDDVSTMTLPSDTSNSQPQGSV